MSLQHPNEAVESWEAHLDESASEYEFSITENHRNLRKAAGASANLEKLELKKEKLFIANEEQTSEEHRQKYVDRHKEKMRLVSKDSGIRHSKEHGIMIDAGSSGSRLHLYEWDPRVLSNSQDVQDAVSGKKISFPYARSRWTDRLRPGVDSFASLPDDKLQEALQDYLSPLIDFAKTVLHRKQEKFETFPIFLRATAGMRILEKNDRARVLGAIRSLFNDNTFCPFYFEDEYARVLSGEEEAIFGWAGINFAMGNLVEESEGVGAVVNPKLTYGAMDLGSFSNLRFHFFFELFLILIIFAS
jgi:Golgi nucleoside diphosphatase